MWLDSSAAFGPVDCSLPLFCFVFFCHSDHSCLVSSPYSLNVRFSSPRLLSLSSYSLRSHHSIGFQMWFPDLSGPDYSEFQTLRFSGYWPPCPLKVSQAPQVEHVQNQTNDLLHTLSQSCAKNTTSFMFLTSHPSQTSGNSLSLSPHDPLITKSCLLCLTSLLSLHAVSALDHGASICGLNISDYSSSNWHPLPYPFLSILDTVIHTRQPAIPLKISLANPT